MPNDEYPNCGRKSGRGKDCYGKRKRSSIGSVVMSRPGNAGDTGLFVTTVGLAVFVWQRPVTPLRSSAYRNYLRQSYLRFCGTC